MQKCPAYPDTIGMLQPGRHTNQNIRRLTKHAGYTDNSHAHHILIAFIPAHKAVARKWGKNTKQRTVVRTTQIYPLQNQHDSKSIAGNMALRAFVPRSDPAPNEGQLSLLLNFEN